MECFMGGLPTHIVHHRSHFEQRLYNVALAMVAGTASCRSPDVRPFGSIFSCYATLFALL